MKLFPATEYDFNRLVEETTKLGDFNFVEDAAQAFINIIYEAFHESFVLLRMFSSIPLSLLPSQDQELVEMKVSNTAEPAFLCDKTPILTLLGSRGKEAGWNQRGTSENFRCIPLISSDYVSSLSMLCQQFEAMSFELSLFDSWENDMVKKGRADFCAVMVGVSSACILLKFIPMTMARFGSIQSVPKRMDRRR